VSDIKTDKRLERVDRVDPDLLSLESPRGASAMPVAFRTPDGRRPAARPGWLDRGSRYPRLNGGRQAVRYRHRSLSHRRLVHEMGKPTLATNQDFAKCAGRLGERDDNEECDRLPFGDAVLYSDHFLDERIALDPLKEAEVETIWAFQRDRLPGSALATKMLLPNPELRLNLQISAAVAADRFVKIGKWNWSVFPH
jgi:hypothetical protein